MKKACEPVPKPVRWLGSSKDDLSAFPEPVKLRVGGAVWDAQIGLKSLWAKPLKGFGGAGVLEIVADADGNAFRAVYTGRCSISRRTPPASATSTSRFVTS